MASKSDNESPTERPACELEFFPGAEDAQRTPLFGGEGRMPLPMAMSLRNYLSFTDGQTRTTVPLASLEATFQTLIQGALQKTGFDLPKRFAWDRLYSPTFYELATQVAQGAFFEMNEIISRPHAELMQRAEKLGTALGLAKTPPSVLIFPTGERVPNTALLTQKTSPQK